MTSGPYSQAGWHFKYLERAATFIKVELWYTASRSSKMFSTLQKNNKKMTRPITGELVVGQMLGVLDYAAE